MKDWTPIRKILAAAITALIAGGGLIGLVAGTGDVSWREILSVALAAALPVAVGYLTPPDARQAVQATAAGKLPQEVLLAEANERLASGDATPIRAGESPY